MLLSICRVLLRSQKPASCPIIRAATLPSTTATVYRPFCSEHDPKSIAKAAVKKERTKTPEVPKIALLDTNDKILCTTTVAEAEKIAASKNLRLVQIVDKDARTVRPVYKLMSEAQYIQEDLEARKRHKEEKKKGNSYLKGEKMIVFTTKITTGDFEMKVKRMLKWLEKKYEVHVLISGNANGEAALEEMYKKLEQELKEKSQSRIVQKLLKSGNLKFNALPPRDEIDVKTRSKDVSKKENTDLKESKKENTDLKESKKENTDLKESKKENNDLKELEAV